MLKSLFLLVLGLFLSFNSVGYSFTIQASDTDSLSIKAKIDSAYSLKETDYKQAMILYKKAFSEALTDGSQTDINHALYMGAMLHWLNGDHITAIENSRQSIILSGKLNDTLNLARNCSLLGLAYLYKSDFDSAVSNFNQSLYFYNVLKDTSQIIKNLGFKGLVYSIKGDFEHAKKNLLETVILKRQYSTNNWGILNLGGEDEVTKKYYKESLTNAKKSLTELSDKKTPSKLLRDAYHSIALAYLKLNKADSSLLYFKKSAHIASILHIPIYWDEQSRAYQALGFYDSAILCNKKTVKYAKAHGTRISLANSYGTLASAYKLNGNKTDAVSAYLNAIALHKAMGHKYAKMDIMLYLADALVKELKLKEANAYIDSAIFLAKQISTQKGLSNGLYQKYNLLKINKQYKEALQIKEMYDIILDSLQKGEVQLNLAKLDLYNEVELNKLEISDLNKQQKLANATAQNKNLIIIIIVIIALFIVLLLALNFYRTRKLLGLNKKLKSHQQIIGIQNQELFKSNKEKEILLGEIHHRVKNNLQTITSLLSIQQRKLKDPDSIKVLEDSKNRVMAMGLIHQHLYQNSSFAEIDFKNYTKELVRVLISTNACCVIDVKCSIPALKIELDNAIFFGLIINELAINSIKHAYNGVAHPLLEISIFKKENKMALLVKDNGNEKDIDFDKSNSFGWKMVNNICEKLEGELSVDNSNGLAVEILFSKDIISIV